jgi:very-short-patch-repair endonuclease/glycosidase
MMEFHVARSVRDRYRFDQSLFELSGNVIFANFHAARTFARAMNQARDLVRFPEQAVRAGQINALGLIDEILHYVVGLYRRENPEVMARALDWLEDRMGAAAVDTVLRRFADEFPPLVVYRREQGVAEYLAGVTGGIPNRQIALEELLLLWLANANPATAPFRELFDEAALADTTAYSDAIAGLRAFFADQPHFGPDHQPLIDMLRSPAIAVPHSLPGQLEYMRTHWGILLGKYLYRLLSSLDLIREEERPIFIGPGPARVFDYSGLDAEAERFSPDRDWMPRLVLMAKNSYVWLHQLSERYNRSITRLDQVPDGELDLLAEWGFTGLWLIGLWERSRASQRIKQLCGNPEAAASAYSLYDYRIADDLGGESAFLDLRHRAWQRGIRLASDMVPNHMAIDSRWVIEHPDYFIGQDYSPFAAYSFNGPDLSSDDRVGVFIEDHYYDRSDAAVVFKRLDRWTGSVRYIYHGNDGTSMPWNDTAQLNYLNPEVREAVIRLILDVARRFPVIRFDAAMTLARRHYQRLWFPEPGTGGDIPSRADHAMTREQFAAAMPAEFWREVVDRVAQEVPDTLLLAEAFWLMEGYFVRTLGMHRVYNSAFMHMLRDEDNAKYRDAIKKTLEFDAEILKRYLNFMNNPDERTAVDQFGKDDKYFGVCTLLATLPGLPMFGHGQVEGFSEKYGMEYRRAYRQEQPDAWLVERHRREIFPLLRRRYLFAEVANFRLYDFYAADGTVNEDVLAYSNRHGDERALVIYHNRFATACGWLCTSAAYVDKAAGGLKQDHLGAALGVDSAPDRFCLFRDYVSGLEFIRSSQDLSHKGLYVELEAYKRHVFLDWREVHDDETQRYAHLVAALNGRGVPSIEEALTELLLQPVLGRLEALLAPDLLQRLCAQPAAGADAGPLQRGQAATWLEIELPVRDLLAAVTAHTGGNGDVEAVVTQMGREMAVLLGPHPPAPSPQSGEGGIPPLRFTERGLGGEVDAPGWLPTESVPGHVYEIARRLRQEQTPAEQLLWACLRNRQLSGLKFRRQHPLGRYIADFYCAEKCLVIELEGSVHQRPDQAEYGQIRRREVEGRGMTVLRFANADVETNPEMVLESIAVAARGLRSRFIVVAGTGSAAAEEPHPPAPSPQSGEGGIPPLRFTERGLGGEVDCATAYAWWLVHRLAQVVDATDFAALSRSWLDEWGLGRHIAAALQSAFGIGEGAAWRAVQAVKILTAHQVWYPSLPHPPAPPPQSGEGGIPPLRFTERGLGGEVLAGDSAREAAHHLLTVLLTDTDVQQFLHVNRHAGVLWFNRESFEQLLGWLDVAARVGLGADPARSAEEAAAALSVCRSVLDELQRAADKSGYQVERLLGAVG